MKIFEHTNLLFLELNLKIVVILFFTAALVFLTALYFRRHLIFFCFFAALYFCRRCNIFVVT